MNPKQHVDELALFGGAPQFSEALHVGRPNIGDRDMLMARINGILDRRWFTNNGPVVMELEQMVADMLGVKHCIAMCNATIALEIAIRAAGLTGEVIVPSFTFVATAHALQWQQITPVFCDIDPKTHCIDPDKLERMITPRTTGILGVHVWGNACNIDALAEIAQRRNLTLIFDAAHAFGNTYKGQPIGRFGAAEVFSFHATKFINAFEGGAIATNDDELAKRMRDMRNFGFAGYDNVEYIGTNGKMTEISAAMAITSLESMDEIVETNRRNYQCYQKCLANIPGISLHIYDATERRNFQYVIVEVDETATGIHRDLLVKILHAENVLARRYFYPGCHQMEPYRSYFPFAGLLLPETERLTQRVVSLPTGTAVSECDVTQVSDLIKFVVQNHLEINARV